MLRECNFPLAGPGCGLTLPNRRAGQRAGRATVTRRGAAGSQDYLAAQVTLLQTVSETGAGRGYGDRAAGLTTLTLVPL